MQPFAGSVTVTEYGPGAETEILLVVTPPPQSNVAPAVDEDAVRVTLSTRQVKDAGAAILTFGNVPDWVTVVDANAVHPFAGSVTVTE